LGVDRRRADFELHSAVLSQHLPNQFEMFDFSRQLFACPKVFAPGESYTSLVGFGSMIQSSCCCHNPLRRPATPMAISESFFGSPHLLVSRNKRQDLRLRPFFVPVAVFVVPTALHKSAFSRRDSLKTL
jgi:hypothetical protein